MKVSKTNKMKTHTHTYDRNNKCNAVDIHFYKPLFYKTGDFTN